MCIRDRYDDINAAQTLGVSNQNLFQEFDQRGIGKKQTGALFSGKFNPYFPSEGIVRRFDEISKEIGRPNPFREAIPTLRQLIRQMYRMRLDQDFYIRPGDWMTPGPNIFGQAPLPATPGVNPQLVNQQTAMGGQNISPRTGLTATETALLSPEEQAMRLRQRGMA
mgnify:CR=1 FL=1